VSPSRSVMMKVQSAELTMSGPWLALPCACGEQLPVAALAWILGSLCCYSSQEKDLAGACCVSQDIESHTCRRGTQSQRTVCEALIE